MRHIDNLQKDVQFVLDSIQPFIEAVSNQKWSKKNGFLQIVRCAVIIRQYEMLEVISNLVQQNMGYAAGPLLRPACEELIWLKYLSILKNTDAQKLIHLTGFDETLRSLHRQDEYAGSEVSERLGLLPYLNNFAKFEGELRENFRNLGDKLNWPKKNIKEGRLPSMYWFAKKTDEKEMYDFLYHATSRFVHFSVQELMRRGWIDTKTGDISIHSVNFNDYWGKFSLYWGLVLFVESYRVASEHLDISDEIDLDWNSILEVSKRIGSYGPVPIITADELAIPMSI